MRSCIFGTIVGTTIFQIISSSVSASMLLGYCQNGALVHVVSLVSPSHFHVDLEIPVHGRGRHLSIMTNSRFLAHSPSCPFGIPPAFPSDSS